MQVRNNKISRVCIAVLVALMMPVVALAQNFSSSVNTYSPYSMYGLGELATPGDAAMRSMGAKSHGFTIW